VLITDRKPTVEASVAMERVTWDRPLTQGEADQVEQFMKDHLELSHLHIAGNFKGVENRAKIPYGSVASLEQKVQLPLSLLPDNMAQCTALFNLGENFSEISFLSSHSREELQRKTKEFQAKLGKGPGLEDVHFKHVLPEYLGKDINRWAPFLGKGHVSIMLAPEASEDNEQYQLCISVPKLPIVSQLYANAYYNSDVPTAADLTRHPIAAIAREITARNACKVAEVFASTFGIAMRHRRPYPAEKKGLALPVPDALTLNPGPIVDQNDGFVKIASGLVAWGYHATSGQRPVFKVGPLQPALVPSKAVCAFVPYDAPTSTGERSEVGKHIPARMLHERVFSGNTNNNTATENLHPRLAKVKQHHAVEEFIVKQHSAPVASLKPKLLFLHQ